MTEDLEAKLRALIDRQEIWDLLLRYARGVDRLDHALVRSCYWDDAIDDHHSFVGTPDDFIAWALQPSGNPQHHGVGNHSCELDGDNAHGETYFTYIGANDAEPHMLAIGRYIDHYQRREGVWKIANRVCVIEKLFALTSLGDGTAERGDLSFGPLRPATRDRSDLSYQRPVVPRRPL